MMSIKLNFLYMNHSLRSAGCIHACQKGVSLNRACPGEFLYAVPMELFMLNNSR